MNFKNKKYIVIEEHNKEYFEEVVQRSIEELGFTPIGGVSVYVTKDGMAVYCQALSKYEFQQKR